MATPNYDIKSTCNFLWNIQKVNFLCLKTSQKIESPVFVVDALENTEWAMHLYPRGYSSANMIGFYLHRNYDGSSTDDIDVYFGLAFLSESGKTLCSSRSAKLRFSKGSSWGFDSFVQHSTVYSSSEYLPYNILIARCKMWRCDEKVGVEKYFMAESYVAVQRRSFQWNIEKFSTIGCNDQRHSVIRSITNEVLAIFYLNLTGKKVGEEKVEIGIHVLDPNAKSLLFKTFVQSSQGYFRNCGEKEFPCDDGKKIETLTLTLSKNDLQDINYAGHIFLRNGVLILHCECFFSTKIVSERIGTIDFGIGSLDTATLTVVEVGRVPLVETVGGLLPDEAFSLREDLGSLYICDVLADMKLRTNTTTIPVHTQILGARSSVFRAMFSNDMKEKTQGCVNVTDLDDDTVRRMLLYIYTDKMEKLHWESVCQLHAAADKYDIASLRNKCTAILQVKLSPTNACQILSLADTHQDKTLKKTVQDYITVQGKTIFNSEEWKNLMDTNIRLAAETLHLNWNKD
ncbi:TD and POZ domain-containing protein 5 [Trichonephila clavata]|uniref:TD and POZ domain-containing protein 5 n=1 Tax=Trichonephila clavata TaxID=2740835 RepID=A0A8X6HVN6_TRICU|nr:TD and POZ domain-containing protein 5 [Trichonephila clavata]